MTSISPLTGGRVALWCDPNQVEADKRLAQVELPDGITVEMIVQSVSERLYKLSGARWMGAQTATVRPHRLVDDCRAGFGPGATGDSWGGSMGGWFNRMFPEGYGGCACMSPEFDLGANVIRVDEVRVDGAVLDPATYTLFDNRRLVRVADPATGSYLSWPGCQRIQVPATEPGTWQVQWTFGQLPPVDGQIAAYAYAVERVKRYDVARASNMPPQVRSLRSQDVDITIDDGAGISQDGRVGIPEVDEFIEAWNPHRLLRRARIYDPDTIQGAVVGRTQT